MALAEYLEGQKSVQTAASPTGSAGKLRKRVFVQFGVMIALGLGLAGWYVGYRVFTARAAQPPAPIVVVKPIPVVAPLPVEAKPVELPAPVAPVVPVAKPVVAKTETPRRPFSRRDASPRAGEKYLQIAAYGPRALDGYLKTLERQGLHPLVAPGPADNVYRILIGPFASPAELEEARTLMKASGVDPILRAY
jgi:hypothetical protein